MKEEQELNNETKKVLVEALLLASSKENKVDIYYKPIIQES